MASAYNDKFFEFIEQTSDESAKRVVPLVLESIKHPESMLDIGGGVGSWSAQFARSGIEDFLCIDGSYVNPGKLKISSDRFLAADLTVPFNLRRKFQIAVCLEVAEHLPENSADMFVDTIVKHAPLVLFSAAIPFQGGANHLNEQWPDYWSSKFASHGYQCFDAFRIKIWDYEKVAWWYRQNILLFANEEGKLLLDEDSGVMDHLVEKPLRLVHPERYLASAQSKVSGTGFKLW